MLSLVGIMETLMKDSMNEDAFNKIRDDLIPSEYRFDTAMLCELKDDERYGFSNYKEFVEWQKECIDELSVTDFKWMMRLCGKLTKGNIYCMDTELEYCTMQTEYFFFSRTKDIILMI